MFVIELWSGLYLKLMAKFGGIAIHMVDIVVSIIVASKT